jgi:hypothetical protein
MTDKDQEKPNEMLAVQSEWGEKPGDHFGYASDEERLAKRGLEDWELVEKIPESQRGVPYWFVAVVVTVLLVAVGLSLPFWGNRPGYERPWVDWGFLAAIVYVGAGAVLVYYMVNMYGSHRAGHLDSDQQADPAHKNNGGEKE